MQDRRTRRTALPASGAWLTMALLALQPWICVEVAPVAAVVWLAALALVVAWRAVITWPAVVRLLRSPLIGLTLAWLAWVCLSYAWSLDRPATLLAIRDALEVVCIVWAAALLAPATRSLLPPALVLSALALNLYGLYQFCWGFERTSQFLAAQHPAYLLEYHVRTLLASRRIIATFFSPDLYADFLVAGMPLIVAWWLEHSRGRPRGVTAGAWRWRLGAVAMLVVASLGLVFTRSVGAAAALAGALVVALWLPGAGASRWRWWTTAATAAVCAGLIWWRWATFGDLDHPHNPWMQRWHYWQVAWLCVRARPWWGTGAGAFAAAYAQWKLAIVYPTQYAHNAWLQWWVETGLVGLALQTMLAVRWCRVAWQSVNERRPWAWGIAVSGITLLLHGLVDYDFSVNQVAFLWWIWVGWMARPATEGRRA